MIAAVRPHAWDLPLFLHVLGATLLFGGTFATAGVSIAAWRRPTVPALARAAFWALLTVAIPAWVLMRGGAAWIYSKEGFSGHNDPTWIGIGFAVAEPGLLILLLSLGFAFWWQRSAKQVAGRIVAGLSSLYAVLLAIAWLAMSGKWG
jgi:hypothetical protein